jgi:hypothetical protein
MTIPRQRRARYQQPSNGIKSSVARISAAVRSGLSFT